jgi:hypothetical protein
MREIDARQRSGGILPMRTPARVPPTARDPDGGATRFAAGPLVRTSCQARELHSR